MKNWFLGLLSIIIASIALFWQYKSREHEMGGKLNATLHSRILDNKGARTIIVCLDDASLTLNDLYTTPTFDNPSEFSIREFNLEFDVQCNSVKLEPSSFVEVHNYSSNGWIYKYKDNFLPSHNETKKPFAYFKVMGNQGRCYIKTKASYDGAEFAFEYMTDVWFLVVDNSRNLSFEDWKMNCKKRLFEIISDQYYDVYYYSRNHQPEYQFDVAFVNGELQNIDLPNNDDSTIKNRETNSFVSFFKKMGVWDVIAFIFAIYGGFWFFVFQISLLQDGWTEFWKSITPMDIINDFSQNPFLSILELSIYASPIYTIIYVYFVFFK